MEQAPALYNERFAQLAGRYLLRMADARKSCDKGKYDHAFRNLKALADLAEREMERASKVVEDWNEAHPISTSVLDEIMDKVKVRAPNPHYGPYFRALDDLRAIRNLIEHVRSFVGCRVVPNVAAQDSTSDIGVRVYFGGSAGSAGATTPFNVTATGSAGTFDPTTPNGNAPSSSGFVGGVFVGALVPVSTVPVVQNLLPGNSKVGAEVGIDFFSANGATIAGLPGGPFGTATGRDSIEIRDKRLLTASGVIDFPVGGGVDVLVKGGYALVNKTVTYNCVTFCHVLPATPQFSESKDVNLRGALVGVGVQMPFPVLGLPGARVGVEYDHVFVSNTDVTLGTLPTRLVGAKLSQDINKLAARVTVSFSDIRLKRDIVRLARLDNGIDLYRYRYLWSDQLYVGVMAQEVAAIMPDAVMRGADGYLRVDYARLGLRMQTWDEWVAAH